MLISSIITDVLVRKFIFFAPVNIIHLELVVVFSYFPQSRTASALL